MEFEKAATNKYSPNYESVERRKKTCKTPVKKRIYLIKLQAATFVKMSSLTGIFKGFCLVEIYLFISSNWKTTFFRGCFQVYTSVKDLM